MLHKFRTNTCFLALSTLQLPLPRPLRLALFANKNPSHQEKDISALENGAPGGAGDDAAATAEPSAANGPTKFTLTANECLLVRELFAWLVEPCLAFLRREVSEMVRHRRCCRRWCRPVCSEGVSVLGEPFRRFS